MKEGYNRWKASAYTWPVRRRGVESSKIVRAGVYATRELAMAAAEWKRRAIGGVGCAVEPCR